MPMTRRPNPPLTPVRLAGLAARPLPPVLLRPGLAVAMRLMARRHPGLFERLAGLGARRFLIDPVDLPFAFLLETGSGAPRLSALADRAKGDAGATAIIRGSLLRLVDLLEGRVDGDALFFTRDLTIEGETEAVVALRNAIDAAEIDIRADLLSPLGPLAAPARRLLDRAESLATRAVQDLEKLRQALALPAPREERAEAIVDPEPPLEPQPKQSVRRGRRRQVRSPAAGAQTS